MVSSSALQQYSVCYKIVVDSDVKKNVIENNVDLPPKKYKLFLIPKKSCIIFFVSDSTLLRQKRFPTSHEGKTLNFLAESLFLDAATILLYVRINYFLYIKVRLWKTNDGVKFFLNVL